MPEVGDYSRHLQGVDARLQRSSNQGWASHCYCLGSGLRSELYNCAACHEFVLDVKPEQKPPLEVVERQWKSAGEIPLAPTPTPVGAVAAVAIPQIVVPSGSSRVPRVTRARSSSSSEGEHQVSRTSPRRGTVTNPSPYLVGRVQRGRPPNGSRVGPVGFKGVRQRKNVRGYLVEIRPPKWKKTIWLGTYNSDREAAGAYDAGIFYTNKKKQYNFPHLAGSFQDLPAGLQLDNPEDADEIKVFVQKEAREAARKVRTLPTTAAARSEYRTDGRNDQLDEDPRTDGAGQGVPVSSATSSSEDGSVCQDSGCHVGLSVPPPDDDWFSLIHPSLDYSALMSIAFDMKQEELSLDLENDSVQLGFINSGP